MSTSTNVLLGVGAAAMFGAGFIGWEMAPRTTYAPPQQIAYASRRGDAVLEQVMEILRAQAEDYRRAIREQAEVSQRLMSQNAQSTTQVLTGQSQAAFKLLSQANNQVERLVRPEHEFGQAAYSGQSRRPYVRLVQRHNASYDEEMPEEPQQEWAQEVTGPHWSAHCFFIGDSPQEVKERRRACDPNHFGYTLR